MFLRPKIVSTKMMRIVALVCPGAGKKRRFFGKDFKLLKVFGFQCRNKTEHKISTQEEHSINHSVSETVFCKL